LGQIYPILRYERKDIKISRGEMKKHHEVSYKNALTWRLTIYFKINNNNHIKNGVFLLEKNNNIELHSILYCSYNSFCINVTFFFIVTLFENKNYHPGVFFGVVQTFDRVRHDFYFFYFKNWLHSNYFFRQPTLSNEFRFRFETGHLPTEKEILFHLIF